MKRKIIITFDDADVNACQALLYVKSAVSSGYISESAGIPHFCWMTSFENSEVNVSATRKKSATAADSLVVWVPSEKKS